MQGLHRQQHLGRGTLIHCLIALGSFVDRQFQIEDLTGLNLTLVNQVNQGRQVFTNRRGASFKMNLFTKEHIGTDRAVVGHAYEANVTVIEIGRASCRERV